MDPLNNRPLFLRYHLSVAAIVLLTATLAMFGNTLFLSNDRIISQGGTDTFSLFIYWRDFGFSQLKQGNLPLWNPHLFSGMPALGQFHAALLYPLNWIYLFLPLVKAINISIALHVFLIGMFMYLWVASRGLHPVACLTAAFMVMFSGANFMHIFAGHLIDICTMTWAPLIFLTVDRLFHRPSLGWHLLGIIAVSMQILAGHPQYVYYTAITVMLYTGLSLRHQNHPVYRVLSVACIYIAGIAMTAIQLISGIEAAREAVRSTGVSYQFASMFAYPPENLISLITPFFYGDIKTLPYWGRAYLWAMTFYIGITGFLLAGYGVIAGEKTTRRYSAIMVVLLIIMALGKSTPVFHVLYNFFPGFNMLRGTSKFIFPATLFLTMLAAIGMDHLIKKEISTKNLIFILSFIGCLLLAAAIIITPQFNNFYPLDICRILMSFVSSTNESYLPSGLYGDRAFHDMACLYSSNGILSSAAIIFSLALIFALTKYSRKFIYCIAVLAIAEIFAFAWHVNTDFDYKTTTIPELTDFYKRHPGDYRVLNLIRPNSALSTGINDIWGYDPGVILRYAQFVGFTQGYSPQNASNYLHFQNYHRLLGLLRLRYIVTAENGQLKIFEFRNYLPRLLFVENWEIIPEKSAILERMGRENFDPGKIVFLEKAPNISKSNSSGELNWQIIDQSTDHLTVNVRTNRDAILLITDNYSKGWQITSLQAGGQTNYQILPANYTLMGVPLKSGKHMIRLEYKPWGFRVGKWISAVSLFIFVLAVLFNFKDRFPYRWMKRRKTTT